MLLKDHAVSYASLNASEGMTSLSISPLGTYLRPRSSTYQTLADFLALQLVLTARSGAPLRLMGSPRVALLNFWIPVGLVLASRVLLLTTTCLVSLCIYASLLLQPHSRLLSACPFLFSKERALSI